MNTADSINSATLSGLNQQENTFSKFVVEIFNMMEIISSRRCDIKQSIQ